MTPEAAARLVFKALSNCPLNTNCDVGVTADLWLEIFVDVDDSTMEKALNQAIKFVKGFPQIADICNAIDEIRRDQRIQPQPPMIARSRRVDPNIARALGLAKQGKIKELLAGFDVSELLDFAKHKFPDISEAIVRRNFNEILAAKEDDDKCFACRYQPNVCATNGFYVDMKIQSDGWIKNEYVRCPKSMQQQRTA